MLLRIPEYFDRFHCLAGECRDSCCIGWEIAIDEETRQFYAQVGGTFGERLNAHIRDGCFVLDEKERCPFLNAANLCDIYTTLGEAHLCRICTEHPRFYEWFGEQKEGGIGLCCEAAAQLILASPLHLTEREIEEIPDPLENPAALSYLQSARSVMLRQLEGDAHVDAVTGGLLCYGERVQSELDHTMASLPAWEDAPAVPIRLPAVLRFLQTLEPMAPAWHPLLARLERQCHALPPALPEDMAPLRRIGAYFLYRYACKALFDGDLLSRVRLAVAAMEVIGALWRFRRLETGACPFREQAELAKAFSKEIEYSEENLEAMLCAMWDEPFWKGADA